MTRVPTGHVEHTTSRTLTSVCTVNHATPRQSPRRHVRCLTHTPPQLHLEFTTAYTDAVSTTITVGVGAAAQLGLTLSLRPSPAARAAIQQSSKLRRRATHHRTARRSRPRSLGRRNDHEHTATLSATRVLPLSRTHDQRARRRVHADLQRRTLTTAISTTITVMPCRDTVSDHDQLPRRSRAVQHSPATFVKVEDAPQHCHH